MNFLKTPIRMACFAAGLCCASTIANAQIGGGVGVGVGGGGVDVDITIGGGSGGSPSGAPLPLLGSTALGHAALIGAGYLGWRRRKRNKS